MIKAVPDPTPVSTPVEEPTEAMNGLPLVHVPPVTVLPKVSDDPRHTEVLPVMESTSTVTIVVVAGHPVVL